MNLIDLLQSDNCHAKKVSAAKGGEYASPCPACGGEDRFHSWPAQGRYWCRSCGKSGDVIQYLRDFRNMGYKAACELLGVETKSPSVKYQPAPKWDPLPPRGVASEWCNKAATFLDGTVKALWADVGAVGLNWLRNERGFSDETIKLFRLGWNVVDVWQDRRAWGLAEEISATTGKPKKLWIPAGLIIPAGKPPARIKIRRPYPGDGPRYYMLPGGNTQPMVCRPGKDIAVIVESELDAILTYQEAGDLVSAIALGSACIRPDTATTEALKSSKLILVSLDADDAGAKESWQWWKVNFPQSRRWPPISGKDPGDMRKAGVNVRLWLETGLQEYSTHAGQQEPTPAKNEPAQAENDPGELQEQSVKHKAEVIRLIPAKAPEKGPSPAITPAQNPETEPGPHADAKADPIKGEGNSDRGASLSDTEDGGDQCDGICWKCKTPCTARNLSEQGGAAPGKLPCFNCPHVATCGKLADGAVSFSALSDCDVTPGQPKAAASYPNSAGAVKCLACFSLDLPGAVCRATGQVVTGIALLRQCDRFRGFTER